MGKLAKICMIFLMAFGLDAQAKNQCMDKHLMVDENQVKDFSGFSWTLPMPTYNSVQGKIPTEAVVDFFGDPNSLNIHFRYDLPEGWVAKYYNVFRVELDVGEGVDAFHYELGDCSGSIGDFAPVEPLILYPIYIGRRSDGSPRGVESFRVRIWGRQ